MNTKTTAPITLPISPEKENWLKESIRDIVDFPKPGIIFKDLTPLFKEPASFAYALDALADKCSELKPKYIAGIEARGFILGPTIANKLGIGFVPVRKPGKLPYKVERFEYTLEYGTDCVEVHADAVEKGDRVVIIDDLLATGGTAGAADSLLKKLGGNVVGIGFLIELSFLHGRDKLPKDAEIFALLNY
jgi:adenine phosphoribosyltransferase